MLFHFFVLFGFCIHNIVPFHHQKNMRIIFFNLKNNDFSNWKNRKCQFLMMMLNRLSFLSFSNYDHHECVSDMDIVGQISIYIILRKWFFFSKNSIQYWFEIHRFKCQKKKFEQSLIDQYLLLSNWILHIH